MGRLFCLGIWIVSSVGFSISAVRPSHTDYQVLAKRYRPKTVQYTSTSAYDSAKSYASISLSSVPMETGFQKLFTYVRDVKNLQDPDEVDFLRRITWLYPQDGCWIRAALINDFGVQKKYTRAAKLFAFGNLKVATDNAPSGSVSWWYHVAPVVKNIWGVVQVIDPAIDNSKPLPLKSWVLKMVSDTSKIKLSVCSAYTYDPYDSCAATAAEASGNTPTADIATYLSLERQNIEELGRTVEDELGEYPPWKPY